MAQAQRHEPVPRVVEGVTFTDDVAATDANQSRAA